MSCSTASRLDDSDSDSGRFSSAVYSNISYTVRVSTSVSEGREDQGADPGGAKHRTLH